jgi:hypothetical protein
VWADEHGVTDRDRLPQSSANQCIFHDHDIVAYPNFTIFGSQYRAMQHSRSLAQRDRTTQHSRWRDVRGRGDHRSLSSMRKNHGQRA